MSDPLQQLRVTKAFAVLFTEEAQHLLDGRKAEVPHAALQLRAALDTLQEGFRCECGHRYDLHEGESGGFCVHGACQCLAFAEKGGVMM